MEQTDLGHTPHAEYNSVGVWIIIIIVRVDTVQVHINVVRYRIPSHAMYRLVHFNYTGDLKFEVTAYELSIACSSLACLYPGGGWATRTKPVIVPLQ